ncbi:MAG: CDP-diacylglycerol--glycerol-3-phosphate 3-phosphatidyltransferase [Planctomycetota bacterium]|jgi:CDP-diacylglycerol--serine O-phosphatidyltransferase
MVGVPDARWNRKPEALDSHAAVKKIHLLPNLLTLANAFCGILAICYAIDAIQAGQSSPELFYSLLSKAAWLVFLGMLFDALDGKVARMVGASSAFGAQLDSFSDLLSFGLAPAILVKVLVEHESDLVGLPIHHRVTFVCAVLYTTMAILRLARFNLENDPDPEAHRHFKGLPSPAAAGAVAASILLYLALRDPSLEHADGMRTPFGALLSLAPSLRDSAALGWMLPVLLAMLVVFGLLMVSRVRYRHMMSALTERGQFFTLVGVAIVAILLWTMPVPAVFCVFIGYAVFGLAGAAKRKVAGAGPLSPTDHAG